LVVGANVSEVGWPNDIVVSRMCVVLLPWAKDRLLLIYVLLRVRWAW